MKCRADFPVKGAIFDMDGTLLDSMHHWRVWDFAALEPWGLTLTEAQEEEARALMTDKKLIEKTGGIVQGMSGSPIIQNGKLVGAVTHVLVGDPQSGFGIFIENMVAETENLN